MPRAFVLLLTGVVLACPGGGAAAAQSLEETLNLVLVGTARDRLGLVEIQNASDCVVKLSNPEDAHFAVFRFNNVDPATVAIGGEPGRHFLSLGGSAVIAELHDARSGVAVRSQSIQITADDPDRDRRNVERLLSQFCSGGRQGVGEAGS